QHRNFGAAPTVKQIQLLARSRVPIKSSTEDSQPSYDAPHPRARQTRGKMVDGRALSDLRQRRIGQHNAGEAADIESLRDRQNPHRNQLSSLRADDCCAQNLTFPVGDDLYMTMRLALSLGTVVVVIRPAQDSNFELARARLRLGQSDLR